MGYGQTAVGVSGTPGTGFFTRRELLYLFFIEKGVEVVAAPGPQVPEKRAGPAGGDSL